MKNNRRGQAVVVGFMIAVFLFICAVAFIQPIKEFVEIARDYDHLGCAYDNLTTGVRATCIITDAFLPYFFGIVCAVGLAYLGGRALYNNMI